MGFTLTPKDYMDYIRVAAAKIAAKMDYITELDAATGDGDHWVNINKGFEKLVADSEALTEMQLPDMLKKIGMTMMSTIGGASGALYGSSYIAAAKAVSGKQVIDCSALGEMLSAMLDAIMQRGNAQPGLKTMIDALYPAVEAYKKGLNSAVTGNIDDERTLLETVKKAALDGAESTRNMEAVKGRAFYQANKGVGHLDPGAVTMSYQIETLVECIFEKFQ